MYQLSNYITLQLLTASHFQHFFCYLCVYLKTKIRKCGELRTVALCCMVQNQIKGISQLNQLRHASLPLPSTNVLFFMVKKCNNFGMQKEIFPSGWNLVKLVIESQSCRYHRVKIMRSEGKLTALKRLSTRALAR